LTPGSRIPIVSQATVRARKPDYLFVMIWPFRSEVIRDELDFLRSGGRLVFGLPRLHVVDGTNYERYLSRPFQDLAYSL
jgi:NDP-4-keto-2,6-dideoxyhexose 3-C-methyltransferase